MITLLLFLLIVPSAWAGDSHIEWRKLPDNSIQLREIITNCTDPQCSLPMSCLAKMEAAMRAMEPYVGLCLDPHDPTAQTALKIYKDALHLWQDTKRECWRQQ